MPKLWENFPAVLDSLAYERLPKERPPEVRPPTEEELERIEGALGNALHSLVNNTYRWAGLEIEGRASETTWDWVRPLVEKIIKDIEKCLEDRQDDIWQAQEGLKEAQRAVRCHQDKLRSLGIDPDALVKSGEEAADEA